MNENPLSKERYQNYLLVEGSDDKHVFRNLLLYYQVPQRVETKSEQFEIKDHQGIDNLLNLRTFKAYLDEPRRRFGVIVDADTDLTTRWQKIRDILEKSGYSNVPLKPRLEGTITKRYLDPTAEHAQQLMDWIRKLFDLETV